MDAIKLLKGSKVKVYKDVNETGRQLGVGSYGTVVELRIGKALFAGKKLHEAPGDASHFAKECQLMSQLDHPNVAKFFGVCKLPIRTVPALVMELIDYNLELIIENRAEYSLEINRALSIFIDIANGLTYLHARNPQVLHRNLTARNVLLDKSMNAKITDFGISRIVDLSKAMTNPETLVYMPPEALKSHSKYSDRFDTFSFGHLALYTLIRELPKDLLPAAPARTEVERRNLYMDKLHRMLPIEHHHFYQLIRQCLHNDPSKRPSSAELLLWLEEIKRVERVKGDFEKDDAELTPSEGVTRAERRINTPKMKADINRCSATVANDYEVC